MTGDFLWLSFGLALLMLGGESVVRGATSLARTLGVSPLVIGLTIVAFGTSAPEIAVNLIAAFEGRGEISFGNIIGSNMANIGLIVGCCALVRPIVIHDVVVARELPMMLLATIAAVAMAFDDFLELGPDRYSRSDGLILLLLFGVFLFYTVGDFVRQRGDDNNHRSEEMGLAVEGSMATHLAVTGVGFAALVWGADVTIDAAVNVARALGVSDAIIGLTILAIGTSLPELVASMVATMRGHTELAIGNVVGSNIFNLLLVMGLTSTVSSVPVPSGGHLDLIVVSVLSVLLFLVSNTADRKIIRGEALLLLVGYFMYMSWRTLYST
jgi:cation:H+ antiporter